MWRLLIQRSKLSRKIIVRPHLTLLLRYMRYGPVLLWSGTWATCGNSPYSFVVLCQSPYDCFRCLTFDFRCPVPEQRSDNRQRANSQASHSLGRLNSQDAHIRYICAEPPRSHSEPPAIRRHSLLYTLQKSQKHAFNSCITIEWDNISQILDKTINMSIRCISVVFFAAVKE